MFRYVPCFHVDIRQNVNYFEFKWTVIVASIPVRIIWLSTINKTVHLWHYMPCYEMSKFGSHMVHVLCKKQALKQFVLCIMFCITVVKMHFVFPVCSFTITLFSLDMMQKWQISFVIYMTRHQRQNILHATIDSHEDASSFTGPMDG